MGDAKASRKLAEQKSDVVIEALYPGALVGKAGKRIVWIPRGNERVPLSMAEDLFGCFDRLVVHPHGMLAIQATIYRPERAAAGGGAISPRKTKVRRTFVEPLVAQLGELPAIDRAHAIAPWLAVEVWGWEKGRAMHFWRWSWHDAAWIRQATVARVRKDVVTFESRAEAA